MNRVACSDYFSVDSVYYHEARGIAARRIVDVLGQTGETTLDAGGAQGYLRRSPGVSSTCFTGIKRLPPHHELHCSEGACRVHARKLKNAVADDPVQGLRNALAACVSRYDHCALALSGGLDSALVLALLLDLAPSRLSVYTLATQLPGYCELATTQAIADYYGVELKIVEAGAEDLVEALPDTLRATEAPLYNLHPVSKYILARAMVAEGVDCMITGDGADQVFAGVAASDYLPIVGAIMRDLPLAYCSPFFDESVIACGLRHQDPNKTRLRQAARGWAPGFVIDRQKTPRLAPELDVSRYWDEALIERITRYLGVCAETDTPERKMLWTTLGLLVERFEAHVSCVP